MATLLRNLSYRYQWLYNTISRLAALAVGGEARFRQLAITGISIKPDHQILDLCCGSGQVTQILLKYSHHVTGLDASPRALERARQQVPGATFVEGWAEKMPFADGQFDLIHISAALHEMAVEQRQQILREIYRVLKPGGILALVDFHQPTNPIFWPGLALFLWLFETETAWELIKNDLLKLLENSGFSQNNAQKRIFAGGSLQVIQVQKIG